MTEEQTMLGDFTAEELAEIEAFIERSASAEHRMTHVEAVCALARLALVVCVRVEDTEACAKQNLPSDLLVDVLLDEEQLEQIDKLIEEQATPKHRLTREDMVRVLVKQGRRQVKQGKPLLPFMKPLGDVNEYEAGRRRISKSSREH